MAKKIVKKVNNPVAKPVTEVIEEVKVVKEEVIPIIPTIFDKYRKYIKQVSDGYLRDITYAEAIEIKDFIHKKTGHNIGITMSCGACLVSLVQTFANLEK